MKSPIGFFSTQLQIKLPIEIVELFYVILDEVPNSAYPEKCLDSHIDHETNVKLSLLSFLLSPEADVP